jgi:hypothetical protein
MQHVLLPFGRILIRSGFFPALSLDITSGLFYFFLT